MSCPRWYYYLNRRDQKNLLTSEKIEDDSLVVSNWTGEKKYTVFETHVNFYNFFRNLPHRERCFFEILLPHCSRKPYLDIDMSRDMIDDSFVENVFTDIVRDKIRELIPDLSLTGTVNIFTSHTEKKLSYHVVVDGWYFQTYSECAVFFSQLLELIPEEYQDFFDQSVYKPTQQFRMLWSHKHQKENTKIHNKDLSYNFSIPDRYSSENGKKLYTLFSSLVGRTEKCRMILGFQPLKKEVTYKSGTASEEDVRLVMDIFKDDSMGKTNSFQIVNVVEENGNLIIPLRSYHPYHCEICHRTHQTENPYLSVRGMEREIFFDCRRSNGAKRKYIGKLGIQQSRLESPLRPDSEEEIEEDTVVMPEIKRESPKRLENLMGFSAPAKRKAKVRLDVKLSLYRK